MAESKKKQHGPDKEDRHVAPVARTGEVNLDHGYQGAPPFRRRRSRNSPITVRNNPKTKKAGTTIQVKMLM